MKKDRQEQAYWLLLTFESGLSVRIINGIIDVWYKQLGRSLQEFFSASSQEWASTCHLKVEIIEKLERAKEKLPEQGTARGAYCSTWLIFSSMTSLMACVRVTPSDWIRMSMDCLLD